MSTLRTIRRVQDDNGGLEGHVIPLLSGYGVRDGDCCDMKIQSVAQNDYIGVITHVHPNPETCYLQ
jgi:hypothetical protein